MPIHLFKKPGLYYICKARYEIGEWGEDADLQTCQAVIENVQNWIHKGAQRSMAKEHINCVYTPLLFSVEDSKD